MSEHSQRVIEAVASDIGRGDDGYWIFWPMRGTGAYTAADLRAIADYLDEKNDEVTK